MRLTEEELKKLYQRQTARPASDREGCLTEEELLRAAVGEMSQSERERVADHIMSCSDCAEEYRLTKSLKPLAEQMAGVEDRSLKSEPRVVSIVPFLPVRILYAIAASLLFISIGLGAWAVSLQREKSRAVAGLNEQLAEREKTIAAAEESLAEARLQLKETPKRVDEYENQLAELRKDLDELSRPQVNVPITDLDPGGSNRGGAAGVALVKVPSGVNTFILILNSASEKSFPGYALEILDQRGKPVWQGSGLEKSSSNTFTITLHRRLFPAGQYSIKLYGLSKGQREMLENYPVRIQYKN